MGVPAALRRPTGPAVNVLVTGGTSLIGAAVVARLAGRGDDVTLLQRRPSGLGHREVLADITDLDAVRLAVGSQDAVVHLAAKVSVTGPWEDFLRTNVTGTDTVVNAASDAGVTRFVHVSSPSVAHSGSSLVGAAATPADPETARGNYSRSKAMAELLALEAGTSDFNVVAVRPHLVWGPGDTQLIGRIVERAQQRRLALVGSGMALIDTTYIDNAADAIVAAVDRAPDVAGRALVVSNGEPRTVRELLERITDAARVPPPRFAVPESLAKVGGAAAERVWERTGRDSEPPMTQFLAEQLATAHWFDQRETQHVLDWTPAVPLAEGFRRLGEWFRSQAA